MIRKQKRNLVVPKGVVKLTGATCECVPWSHELYTRHPIVKGPTPCLAVELGQNGPQTWQGLIVVLPKDAPCVPIQAPEIAAALGIIQATEKENTSKLMTLAFNTEFYNTLHCMRPFVRFGMDADQTVERVKCDLHQAGVLSQSVSDQLEKTCRELLNPSANAVDWSPVVLVTNVDVRNKHARNWDLLRNWSGWIDEIQDIVRHRSTVWGTSSALTQRLDKPRVRKTRQNRKVQEDRNAGADWQDLLYRDAIAILALRFDTMACAGSSKRRLFSALDPKKDLIRTPVSDLWTFRKRLSYLGLPATRAAIRGSTVAKLAV